MFLKCLTINGFKSFAAKTSLELEPGIIAVVGPNGSGKSNIADAIRWALGEQSSKQLRLKKNEELVFAGTEKRAKGSLAEVSLLMDNSDGGMAIDFSEVELSRLLYRSGESEYKLNGRKIRLGEAQQLLAQSGFGQNSYAVIGQGMIDSFILATPAERKLLFDEASGIRQYEIKREQALRKLDATDANLVRVRDILSELTPRIKILGRSVEAVQERDELKAELAHKRLVYQASSIKYFEAQLQHSHKQQVKLKDQIAALTREAGDLESRRGEYEKQQRQRSQQQAELSSALNQLETERDNLMAQASARRVELQAAAERSGELARSQEEIKALGQRLKQLTAQRGRLDVRLAEAKEVEAKTIKQMDLVTEHINETQTQLTSLRRQTDSTSRPEYIAQALSILKQVSYGLAQNHDAEQMRLLVYKAGRLLSHASAGQEEVVGGIKTVQAELNRLMGERESAHEPYTKAVIKVRSLELDLEHNRSQINETESRLAEIKELVGDQPQTTTIDLEQDLTDIDTRVARIGEKVADLRQQLVETGASVAAEDIFGLAAKLETVRTQLGQLKQDELELVQSAKFAQHQLQEHQKQAKVTELAKIKASDQTLEAQERVLAVLEGRLAADQTEDDDLTEEYAEATQRQKFLSEQVTDLEAAGRDLVKMIEQLEGLIKAKFEVAFAGIAEHFGQYFEELFGGGKASLTLKPDATGTYGIEIKAVPPGKRVESLATLSGGERSMTGIALLSAILTVNPSPFVVLDEVDAALDEANSKRLTHILRRIAKHSQLIVITHNRQVMAVADAIFGVTMDAHHVSRLLSVKLEQAREMAQAS